MLILARDQLSKYNWSNHRNVVWSEMADCIGLNISMKAKI